MSWSLLHDHKSKCFGTGVLLRFFSPDTNNVKTTAIGVRIPNVQTLSFFEISGGNKPGEPLGYGQPTLPEASLFDKEAWTVDRDWLMQNFDHICMYVAPETIEVLEYFDVVPLKTEAS